MLQYGGLNMMSHMIKLLLVAGVIAAPAVSQAGVLVSESFDYVDQSALNGANGGTGWDGAWSFTTNGSTTVTVNAQNIAVPAGYAMPTGNQATLQTFTSGSVRVERALASSIDTDVAQTLYMSMLFRRDDSFNGGGTENSEFFRLDNSSDIRVAAIGQSSGEALTLHLGGSQVSFGTTVGIGTDYLLVGKLTLNPAGTSDVLEAQLFNAGDLLAEPAIWQGQVTNDFADVATKFVVNQARLADTLRVDEILIGTTFADVTPSPLSGDLNLDGFVGIQDLNAVLGSWNQTVPLGALSDPSGDGFVGIEDLNVVLGNWNAGTPPSTGAVVPEPSTALSLMALSGIAALRRNGR
jgi:hypothetical protein